jgi:putative copper resistance protein D
MSYGAMLVSKVLVFGGLLALGCMNFLSSRLLGGAPRCVAPRPLTRRGRGRAGHHRHVHRRLADVPASGHGRPAAAERANMSEIADQSTPQWPRLTSPTREEPPPSDDRCPRGARKTSHGRSPTPCRRHPGRAGAHGARSLGPALAVTLHRTRRVPLRAGRSRGLALRAVRFLEGFAFRTILQHYIFVVLVFSFGIFEWFVRTGRLRSAFVFPLRAAVGAGLLLAHSHCLENLKTVYLV